MNIYLPIEVKARELESKVLLALAAASRGHQVLVGSKADTLGLIEKNILKPGIIHHKSIQPIPSVIDFLTRTNNKGFVNTTQDEENGLLDEEYDRFAIDRYSEKTIGLVSKVFCWGRHDYDSLCRIYPDLKNRFVLSGSPRVDFWRKDFEAYYKNNTQKTVKDYILIVSNFGSCLNVNRLWTALKFYRDEQLLFKKDTDLCNFISRYGYSIDLLSHFVSAIFKLSELHPEKTFIIRPHPVEETKAWEDIIGQKPNIRVIKEGSVGKWLKNAQAIIYNGCTTALEAAAMDKPIIAYRPMPSDHERSIPNQVGYNVFTENELIETVSNLVGGNNLHQKDEVVQRKKSLLQNRFSNLTGSKAVEKIADEWETLKSNELNGANSWKNIIIRQQAKHRLRFLKKIYLFGNPKQKNQGFEFMNKFNNLLSSEIKAIVEGVVRANPEYMNVKYKRVGIMSFLFN